MVSEAPILLDSKRRVEKVLFRFDNPGDVEIQVPTITCEKTHCKFFHPDDVDKVISELQREYDIAHQKLKR